MTGYIALQGPGGLTRDESRDFTVPSSLRPINAFLGRIGDVGWVAANRTSANLNTKGLAYDMSQTPPVRMASRDFNLNGLYRSGVGVGNKLVLYPLGTQGVGRNRLPAPLQIFSVGSDGTLTTLLANGPSISGIVNFLSHGNLIWIFTPGQRSVAAYTVTNDNRIARAASDDFTIPASITDTQIARSFGGFTIGSTGYILFFDGTNVRATAFSLPSGEYQPSKNATVSNLATATLGSSAGVWILTGTGDRGMLFYEEAPPALIRTPIDTLFYTDKDRHKIYPKKCWIVRLPGAVGEITGVRADIFRALHSRYGWPDREGGFAYDDGIYINFGARRAIFLRLNSDGTFRSFVSGRDIDVGGDWVYGAVSSDGVWIFKTRSPYVVYYNLPGSRRPSRDQTRDPTGISAVYGAFHMKERNILVVSTPSRVRNRTSIKFFDTSQSTSTPLIRDSNVSENFETTYYNNFIVRGDTIYEVDFRIAKAKAWDFSLPTPTDPTITRNTSKDISFTSISRSHPFPLMSIAKGDQLFVVNPRYTEGSQRIDGRVDLYSFPSGASLVPWYTKDTSIPVISAFQSAPSEIDEDSSPPTNITLTWRTSGTVTRERLTDLHRNQNVPLSGNNRAVVARPLANTVYSLVATNGSFGSSTAKITVPVFKDCVINSFTVQYITNPLSPHGATVYFNINVTGKPRPTVSIDNGVGGANTHLTYNEDTGVLSGRIVHTFAGPRTFTATLTANNTQANGVAGPAATRTVSVIIP